jgi:ABC-type transport system involved in cytochrome c biogenesis ATPase subunit
MVSTSKSNGENPNGAGKTTTIEICEGLTVPDHGTVAVLGLNWATGANELRQRIGIQLQETQFPDKLTVEETLRLFRSFYRRGITVEESIRTAQLEEKIHSRVGGLSVGQKRRLAMACSLVGDPELLFLDEPTTGLDPQARRHLWDLVDQLQQLIASVGGEHIVEFAIIGHDLVDVALLTAIPGVQSHRVDAGLHQLCAYFARILRAGTVGGLAGQYNGSCLGADEPGHVANVDFVRDILFRDALPGSDSASSASASPDDSHRCAAGKNAAGD